MPIQVKICGLSTAATVDAAIAGGASHIGLIFFSKSPRNVSAEQAAALAARVPAHVKIVGVFVDPAPEFIDGIRISARLDVIQFHGHEPPAFVAQMRLKHGIEAWKAVSVRARADLADAASYRGSADRILFDARTPDDADLPGGMGVRFDWTLLDGYRHALPWALSGGLDVHNVAEAVRITRAPMIDVSSGIENAPGVKAVDKIAAFLRATSHL